jgi:hypothetical protein
MAHMEKQTYSGVFYMVETNAGCHCLPQDVCGTIPGIAQGEGWYWDCNETESETQVWLAACDQVRPYVEGSKILNITASKGTLYRLSAPGYMDCTEWTTDPNSPEFDDMDDAE